MGRRKTTQEITIETGIDAAVEIEEIVAEPEVEISSVEEPDTLVDEIIEKGQLYAVYDNGEVVASVYENSAALDELLEYNKSN